MNDLTQGPVTRVCCLHDLKSLESRVFLELGRNNDAFELARETVTPGQNTAKYWSRVTCHSIMGRIAAKRNQGAEEADEHFARALGDAKVSRLPMLELLVARDWKLYALAPAGRDCNYFEVVIDGACAKMNKTRAQLARVIYS